MGLILQNQHFLANACRKKFQLLSYQSAFTVLYLENKSMPPKPHFPYLSYGSFLFVIASYSSRNWFWVMCFCGLISSTGMSCWDYFILWFTNQILKTGKFQLCGSLSNRNSATLTRPLCHTDQVHIVPLRVGLAFCRLHVNNLITFMSSLVCSTWDLIPRYQEGIACSFTSPVPSVSFTLPHPPEKCTKAHSFLVFSRTQI